MDFNSKVDSFSSKFSVEPKGSTQAYEEVNPFKLMVESTLSAAGPEMLGHKPSDNVQTFREENLFPGLVSQFIGPGAAYGAVYKAGKLPKVESLLDKVGDANTTLVMLRETWLYLEARLKPQGYPGRLLLEGTLVKLHPKQSLTLPWKEPSEA